VPLDLNRLIIQYSINLEFDKIPFHTWAVPSGSPLGIISDGNFLYICNRQALVIYNLEGQIVESKKNLNEYNKPSYIDFYQNNFYIIDSKRVSICDFELNLISNFPISQTTLPFNHLKVDNDLIYITIYGNPEIYIHSLVGKFIRSITADPFEPAGLTLDQNYIYVCNYGNHCIQTFQKKDYSESKTFGSYGTGNGQFDLPDSIIIWQQMLIVSDQCSVQLLSCQGEFMQRLGGKDIGKDLGQFHGAWGICVVQNRLYVSDYFNSRIQAFRLKASF